MVAIDDRGDRWTMDPVGDANKTTSISAARERARQTTEEEHNRPPPILATPLPAPAVPTVEPPTPGCCEK